MHAKHGTRRATPGKWKVETDPMGLAVKALLEDLKVEGPGEQDTLQPAADSIDDFMARRFPQGQ